MSSNTVEGCLAHRKLDDAQIRAWADQFNREGYLFIHNVLSPEMIAELKSDLDRVLAEHKDIQGRIELRVRMFEHSRANVRLFDMEPIVTFAETLLGGDCHVIHNNGFRTPAASRAQAWHQDDAPHFLVTSGEPPTNIMLPCQLFTANYYLTDVDTIEQGPTQVIPCSHLLGASPPSVMEGTRHWSKMINCLGKAGSVVIFNNQVWHRGAANASDRTRYVAQVSYARRLVGHKYFPFMNYMMPEHVYKDANPRLRRLLGFLPSGAYG